MTRIPNVTVRLYDGNVDAIDRTSALQVTDTDTSGMFCFYDLVPGSYDIAADVNELPNGFNIDFPSAGPLGEHQSITV